MANRRMISRQIIESGKFNKLPAMAQLLYMRLIVIADDDGFADTLLTTRMIGGSEEDVAALVKADLIRPYDEEDCIYHIKDWRKHNSLERSKYHESDYKRYLREMYTDRDEYLSVLPAWEKAEIEATTDGIPTDNQVTTKAVTSPLTDEYRDGNGPLPQYSIDKDSIVQDSLGKYSVDKGSPSSSSVTPTKEGGTGEGNREDGYDDENMPWKDDDEDYPWLHEEKKVVELKPKMKFSASTLERLVRLGLYDEDGNKIEKAQQ